MPPLEEMLMIEPPLPAFFIERPAVLMPRNAPVRLMSSTRRNSAASWRRIWLNASTPALLTSTVGGPNASTVDRGVPGGAAPLQGALREPQHAGGADRVRAEHAARHVDGQVAVHRGDTVLGELPAFAGLREPEVLEPHRLEPAERHVHLDAV